MAYIHPHAGAGYDPATPEQVSACLRQHLSTAWDLRRHADRGIEEIHLLSTRAPYAELKLRFPRLAHPPTLGQWCAIRSQRFPDMWEVVWYVCKQVGATRDGREFHTFANAAPADLLARYRSDNHAYAQVPQRLLPQCLLLPYGLDANDRDIQTVAAQVQDLSFAALRWHQPDSERLPEHWES